MRKLGTVLVIDDNEITGYISEQTLLQMDLAQQILMVRDGREAVEAIRHGLEPDLILLDLNMPGMGGFQFLEEYQSLDVTATERPKVVIFTTSTRSEDRQKALSYEAVVGFWEKPVTRQKLQLTLERMKVVR